jgi:hypothetical protein
MNMANLDLLVKAWDTAHWEFTQVFEGLADEDVWKRPDPRILSVGELAGHIAYWEAVMFMPAVAGGKPDLSLATTQGPLVDPAFRYYSSSENNPFSLSLGTAEVLKEVERVHQSAKAALNAGAHDSEELIPGLDKTTYGFVLEYRGFHVAYHCGQAYTVRHLLGHKTTDN